MKIPALYIGGGKGLTQAERRAEFAARNPAIDHRMQQQWHTAKQVAPWVGLVIGWTVLGPIAAWAGFRAGRAAKRGGSAADVAKAFLKGYAEAELVGASLLGAKLSVDKASEARAVATNPRTTSENAEQAAQQLEPHSSEDHTQATADWLAERGLDVDDPAHQETIARVLNKAANNVESGRTPDGEPQSGVLPGQWSSPSSPSSGYSFLSAEPAHGASRAPSGGAGYSFAAGA